MLPELDGTGDVISGQAPAVGRPRAQLPSRGRLDGVTRSIKRASSPMVPALWSRARSLINNHWAYARDSGDAYYAVRTTHNLCDRLLRKRPSGGQIAEIHQWTLQALEAESKNSHVWDLWAKTLAALDARETSLDVRWETIRRFPKEVLVRNSLADALLDSGRTTLAEHLLRETQRDFPEDIFTLHLLGRSLLRQGRLREAEATASNMTELEPDSPYAAALSRAIDEYQPPGDNAHLSIEWERETEDLDLQPAIRPAVEWLAERRPLLERYFAPSPNGRGSAWIGVNWQQDDRIACEFDLVVAQRVNRERSSLLHDGALDSWARTRPASYSIYLLRLSRALEAGDFTRAEIAQVDAEFPQHRSWNEWLGYPFVTSPRRSELRRTARRVKFWGGRLKAVYPNLDVPNRSIMEYRPKALRRLFEDVALANADPGLPDISIARN